jgi:hypothetical protein
MLSKRGIDKLEKIMLANAKRYRQSARWAEVTDCGTEMCGAGFCHLLDVGKKKFDAEVKNNRTWEMQPHCIESGIKILGLTGYDSTGGNLFDFASNWPPSVRDGFLKLKTPTARVRFYIKMLRTRVNDDGSIRE